jgi:hypothetical protein
MWRCNAIVLLGLALWTEPASAQGAKPDCVPSGSGLKPYCLTVSVHPAVPKLKPDEIKDIMEGASELLQHNEGYACKVEFQFKGFIDFPQSVADDVPNADIKNQKQLEEVHDVPADVMVVQSIDFCSLGLLQGYAGCAWRQNPSLPRTVIVARDWFTRGSSRGAVGIGAVVLAHEFGHTTGLPHRYVVPPVNGANPNLMTPCKIDTDSQLINDAECASFLAGPKEPPFSTDLGPRCQSGQHQAD